MTLRVPLVDLRSQMLPLRDEILRAIAGVLDSTQMFLGPNTYAFEDEFAAYCGTNFAIGVGNGTDALTLSLRASGIGAGDEVITVANTFIATVEAIQQVGAHPVFVDIDPISQTIAVDRIEACISPRTRAIIPVHLYGRLADMDLIMAIARRHGLVVIEDACQAHGAIDQHRRRAGSLGDLGCFSFYYSKNLGAYGEAGAITTSNPELARRLRLLRSHGEDTRYHHEVLGVNSRLDEIQAAVLRIKLRRLDERNSLRIQHARTYDRLLADSDVQRPELVCSGAHVYHLYVIRSARRDALRQALDEIGISTGIHYPIPLHLQPACRALQAGQSELPITERVAMEILSLPMYPELTDSHIEAVTRGVREGLGAAVNS